MSNKKKPEGEQLELFCISWDSNSALGKIELAKAYGVEYDTAKHWRSQSKDIVPLASRETKPPAVNVEASFQASITPKTTLQLDGFSGSIVNLSDIHFPFEDGLSLALLLKFLADHPVDVVILGGDLLDFYQISDYDKNPARIITLQADIDEAKVFLDKLRSVLPNARFIFLEGNHEDRLRRFLWTKAPELSSLTCLELEELLGLKEREIALVPYEKGVLVNGVFYILHGDIASKYSGYTAKAMLEKHGGCGLAGHCHRIGSHLRRDRFGVWGWWENGCLCDLDPDYTSNPDWVQGFSLVHFNKGRRFFTEQVPIIGHKFVYGGSLYE